MRRLSFFPVFVNFYPLYLPFTGTQLTLALLESARKLVQVMKRVLAPLRLITCRSIEVFVSDRVNGRPQSFVVNDLLECGHVHASPLWNFLDLVNGYSESAHVRAKRHRCRECLFLVAKKPVQSVTLGLAKVA